MLCGNVENDACPFFLFNYYCPFFIGAENTVSDIKNLCGGERHSENTSVSKTLRSP